MASREDQPLDEVMLFLDGTELYATGDPSDVDRVLRELMESGDVTSKGSVTKVAQVGALAATAGALSVAGETLYRVTPEAAQKIAEHGEQLSESGTLRAFVRNAQGRFAGNLEFEKVSFGAEQALALQTAAVGLALRAAIAEVGAAVEAVDGKVSDIQDRLHAREVGEVVGTYRYVRRVANATRERGYLLDADWDQVAGARRDVEIALESLRAYVTAVIADIDPDASLPDRQEAIRRISDAKGPGGALRLMTVAEQTLHLLEYLRLERIRTAQPEDLPHALEDARAALTRQRESDAQLVREAIARIDKAKQVAPLEIHRILSFSQLERSAAAAFGVIEWFAEASRADLPDFDRDVRRPELAEARAEIKRHADTAKSVVGDKTRALGRGVSAKKSGAVAAVRNRRERSD